MWNRNGWRLMRIQRRMLRNIISRNATWCCCVKRKWKKRSALFEMTCTILRGRLEGQTIVMAESDGRTVVRNTSDLKGYWAPTEEQTQDGLNVAEEPAACKVEPTQPTEEKEEELFVVCVTVHSHTKIRRWGKCCTSLTLYIFFMWIYSSKRHSPFS